MRNTQKGIRHGTTLGQLHRAININGRRLLDDAGLTDSASDLNRRILWARTINNNRRLRCTCVGGDYSAMLDERQRECPQ